MNSTDNKQLYEIETIYIVLNNTYNRKYTITARNVYHAIKLAQGMTVNDEVKKYKAKNKIKSINYAKSFVKNNIEFVSFNQYKNGFTEFVNEFNPSYCY